MLKDITFGQYYPVASVLHRMDARVKTVLTILYIILIFFIKNFFGFAVLGAFTLALIFVSKIPFKLFLKSLKPLFVIMLFTSVLNLFLTGGEIIWSFGVLKITKEGVRVSLFMLLRIVFLVGGSSFLMFTTSPITLSGALESIMKPLALIKVPTHEISMMVSIALRFIPILTEEAQKIMMAQKARGATLDDGGVIKRARALIPVLIPLFISAFRRADELATAMEARCYNGGENRTKMKEYKLEKRDFVACVIFALVSAAVILTRVI